MNLRYHYLASCVLIMLSAIVAYKVAVLRTSTRDSISSLTFGMACRALTEAGNTNRVIRHTDDWVDMNIGFLSCARKSMLLMPAQQRLVDKKLEEAFGFRDKYPATSFLSQPSSAEFKRNLDDARGAARRPLQNPGIGVSTSDKMK